MRSLLALVGAAAASAAVLVLPSCADDAGGGGPGNGLGTDGGGTGLTNDGGPTATGDGGAVGALPPTTFLFVNRTTPDSDVLVAFDVASGESRIVTDLRGDGSAGSRIAGYALSPDRTHIALASLYEPTKEDVDTRLATRRIHTLRVDGSDFRRLTPVYPNTGGGRSGFTIEVSDPVYSNDGSTIFFEYGEYWYENTTLLGATGLWTVPSAGGALPSLFKSPNPCSYLEASVDPATGNLTMAHSVCLPGSGPTGIYLYPNQGAGTPELLVGEDSSIQILLRRPHWVADGSGFVFVATRFTVVDDVTQRAEGIYAYDVATRQVSPVALANGDDSVLDGTVAPDGSVVVYCLRRGEADDLHVVNLSVTPPTDTAITNDGKSCHPVW